MSAPVRLGEKCRVPGKIVCVGRNYTDHIEELGNRRPHEMVVFCKPASAIGNRLHSRLNGEELHYEGEICLLMGDSGVAGIGFGLDLTKRALQNRLKQQGLPWERAKAFDGSALFSPFAPVKELPGRLALTHHIDGTLRQLGDSGQMLYPPAVLLKEITSFMSLEPGDIVMTGTPAGVGPVVPGSHHLGRVYAAEQLLAEGEWKAD